MTRKENAARERFNRNLRVAWIRKGFRTEQEFIKETGIPYGTFNYRKKTFTWKAGELLRIFEIAMWHPEELTEVFPVLE